MSSEAAFLEAVRDDPEDDTTRLVFADWLEEHDEPEHARFLRLQCRLDRLLNDEPEYPRLERRVARMERRHRREWLGQLPPLAGVHWEFHRGLPCAVTLTTTALRLHGDAIFAAAPVHCLRFAFGGEPLATAAAGSPHFARLSRLDLGRITLLPRDAAALSAVSAPRLRRCRLSYCQLYDEHLAALARAPWLPGLTALAVDGNHFGPDGAAALAGCASARWEDLDLSCTNLGDEGLRRLAAAPWLDGLRRLSLALVQAGRDGFAALVARPFPRLTALNLRQNLRAADALPEFLAAPFLERLQRLDVVNTFIDEDTFLRVVTAPRLSGLTRLAVGASVPPPPGRAAFSLEAVRALAASPTLAGLRSLQILWLTDLKPLVEVLASAPRLDRLERLDIGASRLGEEDAARLRARFGRHAVL